MDESIGIAFLGAGTVGQGSHHRCRVDLAGLGRTDGDFDCHVVGGFPNQPLESQATVMQSIENRPFCAVGVVPAVYVNSHPHFHDASN